MMLVGLGSKVVYNNLIYVVTSITKKSIVIKHKNDEVTFTLKGFEDMVL